MIKAIWEYRSFIRGLVYKDFKAKYMNSLLGSLWSIINPLAMIVVYTIIFSEIMAAKIPGIDDNFAYSVYLCAGILTWQYFLETTQRLSNIFLDNSNIIQKVNFPRITLPVTIVVSATINFLIIFGIFLAFLLITNRLPYNSLIAIIPLLALLQLLAVGFGMLVGILNVFYRDIGQAVGVFLQFLFWLTPIVYTMNIVPKELQGIFTLNFLYPIISAMQNVFLYNQFPNWLSLVPTTLITFILLYFSYKIYKKLESEMVDEL